MKRMTVPEEGIETLFGNYDENLKYLESLFNVRIRTQGHDLLVEGESPNLTVCRRWCATATNCRTAT
jgi:phosphate starvation-inducible PhoH-like protein